MRLILIWVLISSRVLFRISGSQYLSAGGQFILEKRVTDLLIEGDSIKGVVTQVMRNIHSAYVILATGHSARDIYEISATGALTLR